MIYLWFFYDFFMIFGISFIFHWFSEGIFGNLWFFIDFPRVFLEILDFLNDLNLFFWIFLRNFMEFPWNHKKIIKFMIYFWFFYNLFMIFLWFLGFPLFFIDFPKEFLEIFDFSLIFLEFFLKSLIFWMIWIYFFEFSLGISWNFLEIIKNS